MVSVLVMMSCASPTVRLVRAAYEGNRARVAEALRAGGADLNAEAEPYQYIYRRSLAAALDGGDIEIVEMLLDAGADPNQTGDNDAPVLSLAIKEHKFDVARLLLARGADARRVDEDHRTPLHYLVEDVDKCSKAKSEDIGAIGEALLGAGADPNAVDGRQQGVLFPAIQCRGEELVLALIKAGIKLDTRITTGDTPLLFATRIAAHYTMPPLLDAGADPNAKNNAGHDACAIASANDRPNRRNFPMEVLAKTGLPCAVAADAAHTAAASADATRAMEARMAAKKAADEAPPTWNVPKTEPAPPPKPKKTFLDNFFEGAKERDTSAYDRASACPSGGTYCGKSCCGAGTICCVPDGAKNRDGGVCMAARAGHGCSWGSHQERH
nr:ankyrin repeat domain-containing protein [Nannocystis sp.]